MDNINFPMKIHFDVTFNSTQKQVVFYIYGLNNLMGEDVFIPMPSGQMVTLRSLGDRLFTSSSLEEIQNYIDEMNTKVRNAVTKYLKELADAERLAYS